MFDAAADEFPYTHVNDDTGSWVDEIYYNVKDGSLAVVLEDEGWPYSRRGYEYRDVPQGTAADFLNALSFGTYYNENIKGVFTAVSLGDPDDIEFVPVKDSVSVGDSSGLTFTATGPSSVTISSGSGLATGGPVGTYTSLRTVEPVEDTEGFTPKALSDNRPALVSLAGRDESNDLTWTIKFKVDGSDAVKTGTLSAASIVDAINGMYEVGEMLDVSVEVVGAALAD